MKLLKKIQCKYIKNILEDNHIRNTLLKKHYDKLVKETIQRNEKKHKWYLVRDQNSAKCIWTLLYFPVQKKLKTKQKRITAAKFKSTRTTSQNAACDSSVMAGMNMRLAFLKESWRAFKLTTLLLHDVVYLETNMLLVGMFTGFHLLSIYPAPQY